LNSVSEKLGKTADPSAEAQPGTASTNNRGSLQTWGQLRFLNYYRLLLALLLLFLSSPTTAPTPLGSHNLNLFYSISITYLAFSLVSVFAIRWQLLEFNAQVYAHVMLDITAITLLMHASGSVGSGLGMLLIVAIAGGSLLMEGRTARLFAAIATLAVLAEQLYSKMEGALPDASYTQAGLLGASFFATAILAHVLAKRLRESEALAESRGVDLANMAQLTEYIIQRMQTGIVVIDNNKNIRLINESATNLLGNPALSEGCTMNSLSSDLIEQLETWQQYPASEPRKFHPTEISAEIIPRFANLGCEKNSGTLIFLEDTTAMAQQAQQLKLASLGRLTASIAHEVRNPLGAISHAGQLLAESPHLDSGDRRLTEIITEQSQRVNTIVKNIMQLSRRDRAQPEELFLRPWGEQFIHEFLNHEKISPAQIRLEIDPADLQVRFDSSQLLQILWNLCHNSIQHGAGNQAPALVLRGGYSHQFYSPYLDIIDNGAGIVPDMVHNIFEPFFTTAADGTGLGLYIARELCESNQARLNYLATDAGGHFRITFADPRRRQVA